MAVYFAVEIPGVFLSLCWFTLLHLGTLNWVPRGRKLREEVGGTNSVAYRRRMWESTRKLG